MPFFFVNGNVSIRCFHIGRIDAIDKDMPAVTLDGMVDVRVLFCIESISLCQVHTIAQKRCRIAHDFSSKCIVAELAYRFKAYSQLCR